MNQRPLGHKETLSATRIIFKALLLNDSIFLQSTGKLVFGNKLLPTTLVISFEEARLTYSTKPAACSLDHFMHFIKCKAENFKARNIPP